MQAGVSSFNDYNTKFNNTRISGRKPCIVLCIQFTDPSVFGILGLRAAGKGGDAALPRAVQAQEQ